MIDQEQCAHINPIDASYVCMHKYMFLLLSIIFRYCTILYYQFDGAPCYFFATIVIRWKFHETILHWSCTDFLLGETPVAMKMANQSCVAKQPEGRLNLNTGSASKADS